MFGAQYGDLMAKILTLNALGSYMGAGSNRLFLRTIKYNDYITKKIQICVLSR